MAERGELFEAREWAARAAQLRWPECIESLVEAEKVVSQRLRRASPWALTEEARVALAAGHFERAIDRLSQLARLAPGHGEGRALAATLAERIVALARRGRGELAAACELAAQLPRIPWAECEAATREVERIVQRLRRRRLLLRALPIVLGVLALAAGFLVGFWGRL